MYTRDLGLTGQTEGLNRMEAEFITPNLSIRAEVVSPETRMSDYLNGSSRSVELYPLRVRKSSGSVLDLSETVGHLTKTEMLLVMPIAEPNIVERSDRPTPVWYRTYRCWTAIGHYYLVGDVHAEEYKDPRMLLRALEQRQFLPFVNAMLTYPDGATEERDTVIVNRWRVDLLAVPRLKLG